MLTKLLLHGTNGKDYPFHINEAQQQEGPYGYIVQKLIIRIFLIKRTQSKIAYFIKCHSNT